MKVILFGATGMVGQGVLRECLGDPDVTGVLAIGRGPTGKSHAKLRDVLHENFLAFSEETPLNDVRARATASNFHAFPVINGDGRTVGILSKTDFLKPVDRKLILVDHLH